MLAFQFLDLSVAAYTQEDLNKINARISALRSEMNAFEEEASALAEKADSIENQIAILQNQQASLRTQIKLKQAEYDQIVAEIATTQQRIDDNSETIGYVIAQYYYNKDVSTLERIASSENFSSFIDEEVRLSNFSDTISEIIKENENLKEELTQKKKNAESILVDLKNQKEQLASSEAEQASILAETRSDEAAYRQKKSDAASQKAELEEQQQAILADLAKRYSASNVSAGSSAKGGYPYSGYCPQRKDAFADQWGMYICECVSYAAWKVYSTYGYMPYWGGRGNANQWLANARGTYTISSEPKVGSVGISNAGAWGHAVWVEAVSGDRVYISQYNYRNAATNYMAGEYSEQWINKGAYTYIYFK